MEGWARAKMGCLSWFRELFAKNLGIGTTAKVGPKAASEPDIPGIDDLELKSLARLMATKFPRGTSDRWRCVDEQLRKDLCEPGEDWEDRKGQSAKQLLGKAKKIYALRKDHVKIPATDAMKLTKLLDRLILGPGEQAAAEATEVGAADAPAVEIGEEDEVGKQKKKKKKDKPGEARDYSCKALKQLSMDERSALDLRDEGFEFGEVDPESFLGLLYRLKVIHGHLWPPKEDAAARRKKKKEEEEEEEEAKGGKKKGKGKKGGDEGDTTVADSFYDLGCGAGKAVFLAALFFEFASVGGTEMITGLASAGRDLSERWDSDVAPTLQGASARPDTKVTIEGNDLMTSTLWYQQGTYFFLNGEARVGHV